jgi:hypothetical protein
MQWLQDPNQSNAENLNNVRHEVSRHFRYKKLKLINLKVTVRSNVPETFTKASMILTNSLLMAYIYGAPNKARILTSYIYG